MTRKMTNAPLPEWKHLLQVLFNLNSVDDDKILAPWLESDDFGFLLSRSAWSILMIAQIRLLIKQSK